MPAYNPLGRLKPSTRSFKGLVPKRARAWFKSEISRLRLNNELFTTRRILPVKAGSFSMHSFRRSGIDLRVVGQLQDLHGHGREAVQLFRMGSESVERG